MKIKLLSAATAIAVVVSGCSSRPRAYAPRLGSPPIDQSAFDRAHAECGDLLVAGKLDSNGRLASAAGGVAVGGAGLAVGSAAAAATAGYAGMAVAAATIVLLPFAVLGGAVGMSKMKRAQKEKAIKTAMTGCLKERGHLVEKWEVMSKAEVARAAAAAEAARASDSEPAPATSN